MTWLLPLARLEVEKVLVFRGELFGQFFAKILPTLLAIFIWRAVFLSTGKGEIAGFTLAETISYFILTMVMRQIRPAEFFKRIEEAVRSGLISSLLLRPVSPLLWFFTGGLVESLFALVLTAPAVLLIGIASGWLAPAAGVFEILAATGMAAIGAASTVLLFLAAGGVSFWTVEIGGFVWGLDFLFLLLSGRLLPLDFFPPGAAEILNALPPAAAGSLPAKIWLGKLGGAALAESFGIQLLWLAALFFLTNWLWRKGTRKLELVGG
jgi:ABC-2 type transport system permease protein